MGYVFDVRQYGAKGDGITLDSAAVQKAVDAAGDAGGRVVLPPGRYLCGTIELRSRVTLEIQQGAVLVGSSRLEDYRTHTWGHHQDITPWHLLAGHDLEDVVITGEGTIDGSGPAFWKPNRPHDWAFWREKLHRPSPMVELRRCQNVRVENLTLQNSPGWTLHLHDCDHVTVRGVRIRNTPLGPNTDGIDITGCHHMTVSDCDIDTGDDAIALKTSDYSRSCEYIAITNCVLATSCVAVRLGYESRQDFRYITVSNCVVPRCSRAIDLRSLEGAIIEHVVISGIVGTTNSGWPVNRPIELSLHKRDNVYKAGLPAEHPDYGKDKPVTREGRIRDVTLRDIDLQTDGRVTIVADDGMELSDILIDNLRLRYAMLDDPAAFAGASSSGFLPGDHRDARAARAAIVAKNASNLCVQNLRISWPSYPVPETWHLLNCPNRSISKQFIEGKEKQIRSGEYRCVFKVLWGKRLRGGRIELGALPASDGTEAAELVDCTSAVEKGQ